jgi:hypothetical protein
MIVAAYVFALMRKPDLTAHYYSGGGPAMTVI